MPHSYAFTRKKFQLWRPRTLYRMFLGFLEINFEGLPGGAEEFRDISRNKKMPAIFITFHRNLLLWNHRNHKPELLFEIYYSKSTTRNTSSSSITLTDCSSKICATETELTRRRLRECFDFPKIELSRTSWCSPLRKFQVNENKYSKPIKVPLGLRQKHFQMPRI